jgi:uncharacterized lipoprotein YmbA
MNILHSKLTVPFFAAMSFVVVAGCTVLAPQKDESKFFLLVPASDLDSTASINAPAPKLSIGVGPIRFPEYLQRREIVTRVTADQVDLSNNNRWAEPLDSNFQRVLSQNLSTMLGTQRVMLFPSYSNTQFDYQVEVSVMRFDTSSVGQSQLTARWIIKNGGTGKEIYATESTTSGPVAKDDVAGSGALSRDLADLSKQIATKITALRNRGELRSQRSLL